MDGRKFASESGFFDLRILISSFPCSAAAFIALFATATPWWLAADSAFVEAGPTATSAPARVLYDQYDSVAKKEPVNIPSQDAETALEFFDSQAADDFIVPAGQTWQVTEVDILAEYDSAGPAASFHVFFYANAAGDLPGMLVASRLENTYSGTNDFIITLTEPVTLPEGRYWVSVQARQDIITSGFWLWHNRTVQSDAGAAWQNPGNAFGTGCVVWVRKVTCASLGQIAPDQVFRLIGTASSSPPTPTPTPTGSPTATATATPTATAAPSATARPTPMPRNTPIPRARPAPQPRTASSCLYPKSKSRLTFDRQKFSDHLHKLPT
jgi:hypothetical protein